MSSLMIYIKAQIEVKQNELHMQLLTKEVHQANLNLTNNHIQSLSNELEKMKQDYNIEVTKQKQFEQETELRERQIQEQRNPIENQPPIQKRKNELELDSRGLYSPLEPIIDEVQEQVTEVHGTLLTPTSTPTKIVDVDFTQQIELPSNFIEQQEPDVMDFLDVLNI